MPLLIYDGFFILCSWSTWCFHCHTHGVKEKLLWQKSRARWNLVDVTDNLLLIISCILPKLYFFFCLFWINYQLAQENTVDIKSHIVTHRKNRKVKIYITNTKQHWVKNSCSPIRCPRKGHSCHCALSFLLEEHSASNVHWSLAHCAFTPLMLPFMYILIDNVNIQNAYQQWTNAFLH